MARILLDLEKEYAAFVKDSCTMVDSSKVDPKMAIAVLISTLKDNLGGKSYSILDLAGTMSDRCRDKSILTEALIELTASINNSLDKLRNDPKITAIRFVDFKEGMLVVEIE